MKYLSIIIIGIVLASCQTDTKKADAYGNFEATEIIISAESNGKIKAFELEEGQQLKVNQQVGYIDTTQLYLKKLQLKAAISAVSSKVQSDWEQIDVLNEQKNNVLREQKRVINLIKDEAATQKQLDDISGQILVINKQITALKTRIARQNKGILSEILPIRKQIEQLNDQLKKAKIINPIQGTVLTKFAEKYEVANFGKPLYKIADLSEMNLRAYISGKQLSSVKIGNKATVSIDTQNGEMKNYEGSISWISEKAEFTPKIIQTKEERVHLVYAIKIAVKNDGAIKIGMPAEANFQ